MCDNIDEFEDDIWTRLDRKDALFYFANTQKMIGNMDNKNSLISLITHLDNKKISLMMTTIMSLSNPSHQRIRDFDNEGNNVDDENMEEKQEAGKLGPPVITNKRPKFYFQNAFGFADDREGYM